MAVGLSVCVINYQGRTVLPATLAALRALRPAPLELILIDNASTDGSVALAQAAFPEVTVLRMAENRGPGPAREAGYRAARGRFIGFVDNDVMPAPDCFLRLSAALVANPGAALAMPRILFAAAPDQIQFDGAAAHFLGLMVPQASARTLADAPSETREIGSLISACFLVDRSRWGDQRLQDPSFFIYHEDHDLGLRARQLGHRVLAVPRATALHGDGTSGLSIRATGRFTPRRVVLTMLNRWRVLLTRYELRTLVLLAPALLAFELFQLGGAIAKGWLAHWLEAACTLGRDLPSVWRERRRWQAMRRLGDGSILTEGPLPFHPRLLATAPERAAAQVLAAIAGWNWRLIRGLLNQSSAPIAARPPPDDG